MDPQTHDNAAEFFHEFVEPTVAEFLAHPSDRRLGCLACLCLASMADHYFHARPKPIDGHTDPNRFRATIGDSNWAAGQVIGVANATKHVLRLSGRVGYDDISSQDITCDNLQCDWPINGTVVIIDVGNDDQWLLSTLVEEAIKYWRNRLAVDLGVTMS